MNRSKLCWECDLVFFFIYRLWECCLQSYARNSVFIFCQLLLSYRHQ